MAQSPRRLKFHVLVARPRIDTAIVEVEATDDEEAERKALEKATRLPTAAWGTQPFDPSAYRPHVENMIAEDDFTTTGQPDGERVAERLDETETRYLAT